MTDEEREGIIREAVEKALLILPSVFANLLDKKMKFIYLVQKFYEEHPQLAKHRDVVAQVVGEIERKEPGIKYEELFERLPRLVDERLKRMDGLDLKVRNGR